MLFPASFRVQGSEFLWLAKAKLPGGMFALVVVWECWPNILHVCPCTEEGTS